MSDAVPNVRPENRHALALLEEWMSEPDDRGEHWWAQFEKYVRNQRLSIGSKEAIEPPHSEDKKRAV